MEYEDLDKFFTVPKNLSPFYGKVRIPRKLKKKVKAIFWTSWNDNGQRLWYYLGWRNPNYQRFLIKQICKTLQPK